jgi:hypothetical protein
MNSRSETVEMRVPFEDFFGENSDSETDHHEYRLPKCYIGTNEHLTSVLINKIFEAPAFATNTLLPLTKSPRTALEMSEKPFSEFLPKCPIWDEYHFNGQLIGPILSPETEYLVSQLCSQNKDHLVRFGLCLMFDHGFAMTEHGRQSYEQRLNRIRDASTEAFRVDVISALLECDVGEEVSLSPKERMKLDCERFAEVQKSEDGWRTLDSRAHANLVLHGVKPDAWVLDSLAGEMGEVSTDVTLFRMDPVKFPGFDDHVNILSRKRTIGEYTTSFARSVDSKNGQYETSSRDIMIYDAAKTCLSKVKLSEGLAHCMRFDDAGKLAAYDFIPGVGSDGSDMFFTADHPNGVRFFFEMDQVSMPQQAIKDWTTSVIVQFGSAVLGELYEDLKALEDLVDKLESSPRYEDDSNDVMWYLSFILDKKNHSVVGGLPLLDALLDEKNPRCSRNLIPYGYGSYEGICRLARFRDSQLEISYQAKRAKRAVETLCAKLNEVCFSNLFTGIGGASEEAIFNNLLHSEHAALVIDGVRTGIMCSEELKTYINDTRAFTGEKVTMGTNGKSSFFTEALCRSARLACWPKASSLERLIGTVFLGNAVHGSTLKRFLDVGCVFPFNMTYVRPYQTYDMSAGICMLAGNSTGETLFQTDYSSFLLGDDMKSKMHLSAIILYTKAVVYRKENVFVARDMFCSKYCGGGGIHFFGSQQEHKHQLIPPSPRWSVPTSTAALGNKKSLFAMLVPYAPFDPAADIGVVDLSSATQPSYASSDFYRKLWGWSTESPNTTCFQGLQNMYNSETRVYDVVVQNQGHWRGSSIYNV